MKAWRRFKWLLTAGLTFVFGVIAWAALSSVLMGPAESAGLAYSASTAATLSPIGGALAVAWVVGVFDK